jgi:cation transport protein ChaC
MATKEIGVVSKVDRSVLQRDGVRQAVRDAGHGHLLMPDEQVLASLDETMASHPAGQPVWIFGYGSLIWNPLMEYAEKRWARVRGWHRGFYIWSPYCGVARWWPEPTCLAG